MNHNPQNEWILRQKPIDLAMKEEALKKTLPHNQKSTRYKPDDSLMEFLKSL
jgi:hypothetical protein